MSRPKVLQVRVRADELEGFRQAARLLGVSVSTWARGRLRLAAMKEMGEMGREPVFLEEEAAGTGRKSENR